MGLELDEIVKKVNKDAKETIMTRGLSDYDCPRIPFTSPRMNYMTYGGIPMGRLIEFYGEEHGGKTTTALDIIANYQNLYPDKDVLYVDAENSLDVEWARKIGVDVDKMYLLQPMAQSAEELFEIIYNAVSCGETGLWVLDSIGALLSKQELEKSIEEQTYAGISKPLTLFSKKIEMVMRKFMCTGIGINQLRDDLKSTWGGTKTPGGRGWRHYTSVRIEFSRGQFYDEKGNTLSRTAGEPVGNFVMANAVKNKTAPPTRHMGQYRIRYDIGIDYLADLIEVAILYDIIDKRGAWYKLIDIETGEVLRDNIQGMANVYAALDEDVELLQRVEELVDMKSRD